MGADKLWDCHKVRQHIANLLTSRSWMMYADKPRRVLDMLRSLPANIRADIQAAQAASGTVPDLGSADLWLSITEHPFKANDVRRLASEAGTGSLDKVLALHFAAGTYDTDCTVMRELLQMSAGVNHKDLDGNTPLHIAASGGYSDKVELLLESGAVACMKNNAGKTAK